MLRLAEETLLLVLNDESGGLQHISPERLNLVLSGATLMELALENRLDTDATSLSLLDDAPLNDSLLDPALADIAGSHDPENPRDATYWVQRLAGRGGEIRAEAVRRLVEARILESSDDGFLFLASGVRRSRIYPSTDGRRIEEVRLRIMRVLFSNELPDPRDIVIISLVDACGQFEQILSREELEQVRPRIDLVSRMDLIGRDVVVAIRRLPATDKSFAAVSRSKEIPTVKGIPILGSALRMREDATEFLKAEYLNHGPVFRFKLLNREPVALVGPEANEFVALHGDVCLSAHWAWRDYIQDLGAKRDVLGMDGPEHLRLRRALSWGYSKGLYEQEIETAISIVRGVLKVAGRGQPVAAHRMFQRMVVEQIGTIAAGFNAGQYVDDLVEFFDIMLLTRVVRMTPKFLHARRLRKLSAPIYELCKDMIGKRAGLDRTGQKRDLVDDIQALHRQDPQFLPESDFRVLFTAPFVAGIDTAAGTAAFMLYSVMRHPGLIERMRAEIDPIFDSGDVSAKALRGLDVTNRVAHETLRRYPLGNVMIRQAVNSFEFAGYTIPVGTPVMVGHAVTHFLPEFFPEPYRFDIDRYLPERSEHKQRYAYVPFGLGNHRCLGSGFAEALIALTIATIVRDTDPEFANPNYRLKTSSSPTLRPDKKFRIRFPPRSIRAPVSC